MGQCWTAENAKFAFMSWKKCEIYYIWLLYYIFIFIQTNGGEEFHLEIDIFQTENF